MPMPTTGGFEAEREVGGPGAGSEGKVGWRLG